MGQCEGCRHPRARHVRNLDGDVICTVVEGDRHSDHGIIGPLPDLPCDCLNGKSKQHDREQAEIDQEVAQQEELRRSMSAILHESNVSKGMHPSHDVRFSWGASTYDYICNNCHRTDETPGGWGLLAEPCPTPKVEDEFDGGAPGGDRFHIE